MSTMQVVLLVLELAVVIGSIVMGVRLGGMGLGVYFLPANGNQLAVVNTDLSGSTKIGKYVLNHSFMVPLLVCTTVAVGVGLVLQNFIPW